MNKLDQIMEMYLLDKKSIAVISEELNIAEDKLHIILKPYLKKNKSNLESTVGEILNQIYPKYKITEQVPIGSLFLDYYIKELRLGVEADGIQHFQTNWFHGKSEITKAHNFEKQVYNDNIKNKLCAESGIYLIRISYKDTLTIHNVKRIIDEHMDEIIRNLNEYASKHGLYV